MELCAIQMNLRTCTAGVAGVEIAAAGRAAKCVGGILISCRSTATAWALPWPTVGRGAAAILIASVRSLQIEARQVDFGLPIFGTSTDAAATPPTCSRLPFGVLQLSSRRFRYINGGHCSRFVQPDGAEAP
jgi:hypothetical protein